MRRLMIASVVATTATLVMPASAQPRYAPPPTSVADTGPERRWADAQARYRAETDRYNAAWEAYQEARGGRARNDQGPPFEDDDYGRSSAGDAGPYARAPIPDDYRNRSYPPDDRYENDYDPARHYRTGDGYREQTLDAGDRVYAGSDGRYYCRRSDGTTGLIAGGAAGGILGNVIDGGHSRTAGTLIGGAVGALLGRSVEQNQQQIRCR